MNEHQPSHSNDLFPNVLTATNYSDNYLFDKHNLQDQARDMDMLYPEDMMTNQSNPFAPHQFPVDQRQRRKEQNRVAQRAFRERKERYVKELEQKIKKMEKDHAEDTDALRKENELLRSLMKQMESEMYTLKGAALAFELSMKKLHEAGIKVPDMHGYTQQHPFRPAELDTRVVDQSPAPSPSVSSRADEFAEPGMEQFDHTPDPITLTDAKLIPYSKVWELISEHPRFDEFDLDELCEELKSKAKCSGTGPVIEETELNNVLQRMDKGHVTSI
ncbi:hypothetical protein EC973_008061 [Apophysomyces ossiformis]|uniref:BZIP domain-containing protein n=1 Tax=Apophysomyces ossiformis TaxID=679940 RepID=A0A8H7BNY2_9FUNG|nr:hypothetical protein EC973_008061 [Apophysomyces ossiformis]